MAIVLALTAALAYGLSDFVGGVASRRTSAWPVAFLAPVGATAAAAVGVLLVPGSPSQADLLWGALAGVGSGLGGAFLYRGLASGSMGVVAPISAVGAAVIPLPVAVALGERPGAWAWIGIALALPGIWLVSREPESHSTAAGVFDGILAGFGFGLIFVATGQITQGAGMLPVVTTQSVAIVCTAAAATLFRQRWLPRVRSEAWGLVAGALATIALTAFMYAAQRGYLSITAVLTSLYPAATIALAAAFLKERFAPSQTTGMILCLAAVACVSLAG